MGNSEAKDMQLSAPVRLSALVDALDKAYDYQLLRRYQVQDQTQRQRHGRFQKFRTIHGSCPAYTGGISLPRIAGNL